MHARCGSWIKVSAMLVVGVAIGVAMPGAQPTTAKEVKKVEPARIGYVNIAKVLRDSKWATFEGGKIMKYRKVNGINLAAHKASLIEVNDNIRNEQDPESKKDLETQAAAIQECGLRC